MYSQLSFFYVSDHCVKPPTFLKFMYGKFFQLILAQSVPSCSMTILHKLGDLYLDSGKKKL